MAVVGLGLWLPFLGLKMGQWEREVVEPTPHALSIRRAASALDSLEVSTGKDIAARQRLPCHQP